MSRILTAGVVAASKRRIDPDAGAFINLTGATDKAGIGGWVKGLKALGLWNDIISYPLRSTQNYGSGNKIASLGGHLDREGSLSGPYTWDTDGFVCPNNSGIIGSVSPTISFAPNATQIIVIDERLTASGSGVTIIQGASNIPTLGFVINGLRGLSHRGTNLSANHRYPERSSGNFSFCGAMLGSTSCQLVSDATYSSNFIHTLTDSSLFNIIFRATVLSGVVGDVAYATSILFPTRKLTQEEIQAVRGLYKNTLGLGLPMI